MNHFPEQDVEEALRKTLMLIHADERFLLDWFGGEDSQRFNDAINFFSSLSPDHIGPSFQGDERSLPAISILSGGIRSVESYVGDYLGSELAADGFSTAVIIGERQRGTVSVDLAALGRDELSFLIGFVNATLIMHRRNFDELGLDEMYFTSSKTTTDFRMLGRAVYQVNITVDFTFNTEVAERYGPIPYNLRVPAKNTLA